VIDPMVDRETGKALQEERVRESHQINELRQRRFAHREAHADNQTQIRHYEEHCHGRANRKRGMDRNVIDEISQQQMECKEQRGQEKIIHRMQLDAAHLLNKKYFLNADGNNNISPGSPRALRVSLITRF